MTNATLRPRVSLLLAMLALVTMMFAPSAMAIDTVWNFDGDLIADAGISTMSYRGNTSTVTLFDTTAGLGIPSLLGSTGFEMAMAFPAAGSTQGYTVAHNGVGAVDEYTMMWDVLYPESSDQQWRPLLQTDAANASDGDLFVRNVPWGGVGINNQYHGALIPNEWNRVAVTRDASGTWRKYVNGGYVGEQDASSGRFSLDPTYHLFTDNNSETASGYVSSYRYLDRTMTNQEILQLGGAHAGGTLTAGAVFDDPSVLEPGSFTIAVLGDTQNYSQSNPTLYAQQTQWLVDHKVDRNIQMVLHVGDIVNVDNTTQWNNAVAAQSTLDGEIPYTISPGNHDYSSNRANSQFNQVGRFGPGSSYTMQSTLGGFYPAEPTSRMNTYHTFEANGQDYLIMSLEFGPRDGVVTWAEGVVDAHPDHEAILVTHAYMYDGGEWFDSRLVPGDPQGRTYDELRDDEINHPENEAQYNPKSYGWASDSNDGWDLWDKLVRERDNLSLVITGHQFDDLDGFPYKLSQGDNGRDVYQMLVNMQARQSGGEGWIRLLEFSPDGSVTVKSYSPYFDEWSYASDENFAIQLTQPITGDFDGDGDVDGADFLTWQQGFGTIYDSADLADWEANYGAPFAVASAAVPEPSTLLLLTGFACALCTRFRFGRCG